jgi:hypothetical protein
MRIVVRPPSFTSLHKLCGEQLARGGLYLTKDLQQAQFAAVDVVVEAPDGERFELACEVMQVFAGSATALSVKPAGRAAVDALMAYAMKHPADGADGPFEIHDDDEADDDDDDGAIPADAPLALQVAAMTIAEKRQAGLHGGKDMRFLIIKDNNKTLHPFVLNNPAISIDEVEAISRMTSVNPEVLHRISKDYTRSTNIMRNLVKNPKTPLVDALNCIDKLALSDVRAIAKGGSVKNAILMAARKRLAL